MIEVVYVVDDENKGFSRILRVSEGDLLELVQSFRKYQERMIHAMTCILYRVQCLEWVHLQQFINTMSSRRLGDLRAFTRISPLE